MAASFGKGGKYCQNGELLFQHPPFCPIHQMTDENKSGLPPDIFSRGIDCGAAVILESGDGQVFLTRRGDHLRTFPGIWVPPGIVDIMLQDH
jgi:hypothetical protein